MRLAFNFVICLVFSSQLVAWAEARSLEFSSRCLQGPELSVSAVGDVLLHAPLQKQAFNSRQTFLSLWPSMIPIFQKFDVSYANFEGPSAEDLTAEGKKIESGFTHNSDVYTSYPSFNYHPLLVRDLLQSGIDVVSTANNHSLDRRKAGADLTIEAMKKYGLLYTGTQIAGSKNQPWHTITEAKGLRIAWLACTFSTNGISDHSKQVLLCYQNRAGILKYVTSLSKDPNINAVIVTPHWGIEYDHKPAKPEVLFAHQLIDAGALAVIGTHPHVIQPWEKYTSPLSKQEGLIVYSTGNFVSSQFHRIPTQVGLMIGLNLVLDSAEKKLKIKQAKYVPLLMKRYPYRVEPILNDQKIDPAFASIWQNMYPQENRIKDFNQIFTNQCP